MKLSVLRNFIVIAQCGSLTRADFDDMTFEEQTELGILVLPPLDIGSTIFWTWGGSYVMPVTIRRYTTNRAHAHAKDKRYHLVFNVTTNEVRTLEKKTRGVNKELIVEAGNARFICADDKDWFLSREEAEMHVASCQQDQKA